MVILALLQQSIIGLTTYYTSLCDQSDMNILVDYLKLVTDLEYGVGSTCMHLC